MLRRLVALVLLSLAISPFTAPFSTCDSAVINPTHQEISASKTIGDTSAIASLTPSGLLSESVEPVRTVPYRRSSNINKACPLVLRL